MEGGRHPSFPQVLNATGNSASRALGNKAPTRDASLPSTCSASVLRPHLVLLSSLLNRDHVVVTVVLGLRTHPAKDLPIFLAEQVQSLPVHLAPLPLRALLGTLANLFKALHHAGQRPIGSEVPDQEGVLTHRTDAAPVFPDLRDAVVAEAVATFNAHRLHYGIQADGAHDLLPHHRQGRR